MTPYAWPFPRFVAHRGGGTLAPENTLAAFDEGRRRGYCAAETDAALSADGVAFLLHDATLERTTSGSGCVAQASAAELARLDAGAWFAPRFAGTALPTLEQALAHCHAAGIWLNLEIKPVPGFEVRTGAVVAATVDRFLAANPAAQVPLLSSFSGAALAAARDAAPALPRGLLFTRVTPDWREMLAALDCVSLHCDHRPLARALVREVRGAGYGMLCYTVNEAARAAELFGWGVDAICTDRIDLIAPAPGN